MAHALDCATRAPEEVPANDDWLGWAVLGLLAVGTAAVAWCIRDCYVDDAFTGFQYLRNVLAGQGFVFHLGDPPVEGVSNIGWLMVLAPMSVFWPPWLVAKLTGLMLLFAALTMTMLLGRKLMGPSGLNIVPLLLLAASFDFVYFALAGMETALLAVLLLTMAWIALGRPTSFALPILGAFAFLVHPEAVLVYPLYFLLWEIHRFRLFPGDATEGRSSQFPAFAGGSIGYEQQVGHRRVLKEISLFVLLVGGVTALRYAYFHDVVPNTFHSKPSNLRLALENGLGFLTGRNSNVPGWLPGWLLLPMLGFGYRRALRTAPAAARMLVAISVTGILFAVYSRPDWTATARYFAPYLPAALLLFWAGAGALEGERLKTPLQPAVRRTILHGAAAALLIVGLFGDIVWVQTSNLFPGYVMTSRGLIPPALWVRDHLPADATIATRRIGVLAFYSGHPIFDYAYGLPDPAVARRVAGHGHWFDLPTDAALADLWRARAPEFVLEDSSIVQSVCKSSSTTPLQFSIHGLNYRVIKRFSIGSAAEWVLARRLPEKTQ